MIYYTHTKQHNKPSIYVCLLNSAGLNTQRVHNPSQRFRMFHVKHSETNNTLIKKRRIKIMRKEMVTRTVIGTLATVKVVSTVTDAISVEKVRLNKAFTDVADSKLAKAVRKALSEDLVIIKIEAIEPMNKLYGLDTSKFMEMAVELDPATRKPLAVEEFEDADEFDTDF